MNLQNMLTHLSGLFTLPFYDFLGIKTNNVYGIFRIPLIKFSTPNPNYHATCLAAAVGRDAFRVAGRSGRSDERYFWKIT